MVAYINATVWGAELSPRELMRLPWEEAEEDSDPWSYEDTMASGVGLLDNVIK